MTDSDAGVFGENAPDVAELRRRLIQESKEATAREAQQSEEATPEEPK